MGSAGSSTGVRGLKREVDHSPIYSARVAWCLINQAQEQLYLMPYGGISFCFLGQQEEDNEAEEVIQNTKGGGIA
jgi:hypothetical protein